MDEIPIPLVLDPDRRIVNDETDFTEERQGFTRELAGAFEKTSQYGQQLWHELNAVRAYLHETSPEASAGDEVWQRWQDAYASVTSLLCGPRGDSGYGAGEARREAEHRRAAAASAPPAAAPAVDAASTATPEPVAGTATAPAVPVSAPGPGSSAGSSAGTGAGQASPSVRFGVPVAAAVLGALLGRRSARRHPTD